MSEVTLASLARDFGWVVEDEAAVDWAERVLRRGGRVGLCVDPGLKAGLLGGATGCVEWVEEIGGLKGEGLEAAFVVTHRLVEEELRGLPYPAAVIRPRDLAVGLECERGISPAEVERGVSQGLRGCGLAWSSVAKLATLESDGGKAALAEFAGKFRLPLEMYSREQVRAVSGLPDPGGMILGKEGDSGYAEPVAVLSGGAATGRGSLIAPKTRSGRLSLAVALISPPRP